MALAYSCHSPAFAVTPRITCRPAVVIANFSSRSNNDCRGVRRRLTGGLFPPLERGQFKAPLKVAESYPKNKRHCTSPSTKDFQIENLDKDSELDKSSSDGKAIGGLSMRDLISIYREALLTGVTEKVHAMESAICSIEREKNELATKAVELTAEVDSTKKKFLLLNADLDNFRKHSEKERIRLTKDSEVEVINSLLPMVDSFEKVKQHLKAETEKEKKIDASYRGIYKQFVETLRALGVSAAVTTGKQFDPLWGRIKHHVSKMFSQNDVAD